MAPALLTLRFSSILDDLVSSPPQEEAPRMNRRRMLVLLTGTLAAQLAVGF
jgi:hypothetical protein